MTGEVNMTGDKKRNWICFQIGAREHYAIERALLRTGSLQAMVTDIWAPPDALFGKIPFGVGKKMLTRFHPELVDSNVIGFNRKALQLETSQRLKGIKGWEAIIARNEWFQEQSVPTLKEFEKTRRSGTDAPVVFSYSYAARKLFEAANRSGCTTVLGQVDPGPYENRLVRELSQSYGIDYAEPPSEYWGNWRAECDLADRIVVNSTWSANALANEGIDADKIRIVPLAYEVANDVQPLAVEPVTEFSASRPLRVLFLGQVIARKGIVELTSAIQRLADADAPVQWTIVGGGDPILLQKLKDAGAVVCGQVSRERVTAYYRNHDVFILPTHSDGYAITQLEAAAFGMPIIASANCGEVVKQNENGVILDEVSPDSICRCVNVYLAEPELVAKHRKSQLAIQFSTVADLGVDLATLQSEFVSADTSRSVK